MTEKSKQENKSVVRKPSFWVYTLPTLVAGWLIKLLWHVKIDKSDLKKLKDLDGPILAIGNHGSRLDVVTAIITLFPKRFNIVTGKDLFTWSILKPFIKGFGAIPKNQCAIDLTFMKTIKGAATDGRNILLYPEGRTSMDGKQLYYLGPQIAKFVKFLECNVVILHSNGSYLTHPRYAHGFRKGKIEVKATVLGTKDEIKAMPNGELYKKITEGISFNDHVWQRENNIRFKCKTPAENLNYILYKCPKCGAEYEMTVENGRELKCLTCGNTVEYDEYGNLIAKGDSVGFERLDLWYDFERKSCTDELQKENFEIRKKVKLLIDNPEAEEFSERGEGELYLKLGEIGYEGTLDGEAVKLTQNLKQLNTVVTKNSEGIDLIFDETIYRFLFVDKKWSAKYGLLVEQNFIIQNGIKL